MTLAKTDWTFIKYPSTAGCSLILFPPLLADCLFVLCTADMGPHISLIHHASPEIIFLWAVTIEATVGGSCFFRVMN